MQTGRAMSTTAHSATRTAAPPWSLVQKGVLAICLFQLGWATAGLIAEPSFDFGAAAPTATVLWVDFNGVHALSGFLLFAPGLLFATRKRWAMLYSWLTAGALIVTGLWALASTSPASVFSFPNNERDAALHIGTGVLFATLALIQVRRDRAAL